MLLNEGVVRSPVAVMHGTIRSSDLVKAVPFDNQLVKVRINRSVGELQQSLLLNFGETCSFNAIHDYTGEIVTTDFLAKRLVSLGAVKDSNALEVTLRELILSEPVSFKST